MNTRFFQSAISAAALWAAATSLSAAELPSCAGEAAAAVAAFNNAWTRAVHTGQPDRIAELYSADAVLMPPTDDTLIGAETISDYFVKAAPSASLDRYSVDPVSCERDENAITLAGVWGAQQRTGNETVTGNLVRVLKRQPGGSWKSAYEIWN